MKTLEIPVLIVGGGPVGLCASILLSHHGVPSLLVERHTGTSIYPNIRLYHLPGGAGAGLAELRPAVHPGPGTLWQ